MTASPDSARPATRRALRERNRARTGADGDPGASAETPTDAGTTDAATAVLTPAGRAEEAVAEFAVDTAETTDGEFAKLVDAQRTGADDEPRTDDDGDALPETAFLLSASEPVAAVKPASAEALPATEFLTLTEPGETAPVAPHPDPVAERADATPFMATQPAPAEWADERRPPTALTWIDSREVAAASAAPALESSPAPDILAGARLTPGWLRPRVLTPLGILAGICGAYVAATLLWPLDAVAPEISAVTVETAPAPAAALPWPSTGSAAVSVQGLSTAASTSSADEIASISKVASVLMVLEKLPLEVGEQGPSFEFDAGDARDYWQYRWSNQSALDVPVGGSLTEYQMLQGVLLGSANNYIDRLAEELWGGDAGFAEASRAWLREHGISGMTLESPSGFDERNVATPAALVALGELGMKNPVLAEIVGTRSAEIPGAGTVTNTNEMLGDTGVIGIKTGTLSHWNLLTAKEVPLGDTTVRVFAAVLGQDDNDARVAVARSLLAEVDKALVEQPVTVPAGTVVGRVTTEWGETADVLTDADAQVVLWNGAVARTSVEFSLGDDTGKGAEVGTFTTQGPLDTDETTVSLSSDVEAPSIWWRLTHPLELFGLDKD
ncbi:D-alanyl-D-alanine carboxypeptidase [Microbacterium sp.]|uniref:D-alanyl-D-alanine carboxypeptidase family protein n=1 Tax=Microbacterium sp. TaxID=51671 RepID=UPI0028112AD4|nr:D-alanyl-D-alanine carboxypeptidase [Microbacterium sp.]